jgi:hypothetical protein
MMATTTATTTIATAAVRAEVMGQSSRATRGPEASLLGNVTTTALRGPAGAGATGCRFHGRGSRGLSRQRAEPAPKVVSCSPELRTRTESGGPHTRRPVGRTSSRCCRQLARSWPRCSGVDRSHRPAGWATQRSSAWALATGLGGLRQRVVARRPLRVGLAPTRRSSDADGPGRRAGCWRGGAVVRDGHV